jgi:hypothetical protein
MMEANLKLRGLGTCLWAMLLCSCAAIHHQLPADVAINSDAGRGNQLVVMLQLESGEEVPFVVDTGAPATFLDKSFEPKLGKRLGTWQIWSLDTATNQETGMYVVPRLFLRGTALRMSGSNIFTFNPALLFAEKDRPVMGVLGMNCLEHYCIQMDFEGEKMRFLDPRCVNSAKLGKAFPLIFSSEDPDKPDLIRPFIRCGTLIGEKGTNLLVDTGCDADGGMRPALFGRTNANAGETVQFTECVWGGETYTNITITTWPTQFQQPNTLGLRFLARHLVTFDFPNKVMYLKRVRSGPLPEENAEAGGKLAAKSAARFLVSLKQEGLLPGWSKQDRFAASAVTGEFFYPSPDFHGKQLS